MEAYKTETVRSYNKHAAEFSKKFKNLMDLERRDEFRRFVELVPGKRVLDLGCGSGDHAAYFMKSGFDVTAIDNSKSMIRIAKQNGVHAILMDIEKLKFQDQSFNGIWSVTSLIHIPKSNLPRVIKKLHRILAPSGVLFVCAKMGDGEGFISDENSDTKRFFSFWKRNDLMLFNEGFDLIDYAEISTRNRRFMQFLLRRGIQ